MHNNDSNNLNGMSFNLQQDIVPYPQLLTCTRRRQTRTNERSRNLIVKAKKNVFMQLHVKKTTVGSTLRLY